MMPMLAASFPNLQIKNGRFSENLQFFLRGRGILSICCPAIFGNKFLSAVSKSPEVKKEKLPMNTPTINVTPLIDVLLVLLIIFMVVAPLKPSNFRTRIPSEPKPTNAVNPNPDTLIVFIGENSLLTLNKEAGIGTVDDPSDLIDRLKDVFEKRVANGNVSASFADDQNRPANDRIERTVFIKARRSLDYGSVARVVDAVKLAGAYPISLQIDDLD